MYDCFKIFLNMHRKMVIYVAFFMKKATHKFDKVLLVRQRQPTNSKKATHTFDKVLLAYFHNKNTENQFWYALLGNVLCCAWHTHSLWHEAGR